MGEGRLTLSHGTLGFDTGHVSEERMWANHAIPLQSKKQGSMMEGEEREGEEERKGEGEEREEEEGIES